MPGFYADGEYDVAGFIVGAVERERLIDGTRIARRRRADRPAVLGPAHQRLLARAADRVRRRRPGVTTVCVPELGATVGEALLVPHRSYLPVIRPLLGARRDQGHGAHHRRRHHRQPAAHPARRHRTPRSIARAWDVPPLFQWLQRAGSVPDDDMLRTFNMGIGLDHRLCAEHATRAARSLALAGSRRAARAIGRIRLPARGRPLRRR